MPSYYGEGTERSLQVRRLFTKIARHYDLVNDVQSLGMHRRWKKQMIEGLKLKGSERILDLACGSGDLALGILKIFPNTQVIGGDFTHSMLGVAQTRAHLLRPAPLGWIQLDGSQLPVRSGAFDAVTVAYGLRNMAEPSSALAEMARILKSGGKIAILDLGKPSNTLIRKCYFFFLRTLQPLLGKLFFGDAETYRYLYESLVRYPAQEGVTKLLEGAGFHSIECREIAMGTMSLHFATRS